MRSIEDAWHKLNCAQNEALIIVADTNEGPEFCHLAAQVVDTNNGIIVYVDDDLTRRQKAINRCADLKVGTLEQLYDLKASFTEGYGFTKAVVVSDCLSTCITQVVDVLAKGSVLMLRSQDQTPPVLDFSTSRLHYDQLTLMAG